MFKPGDKVRIKSFGEIESTLDEYPSPGFTDEMEYYCGEFSKITKIENDNLGWFNLSVDNGEWAWDSRWLEKYSVINLDNELFEI